MNRKGNAIWLFVAVWFLAFILAIALPAKEKTEPTTPEPPTQIWPTSNPAWAPTYIPPVGISYVGILNPGDSCQTPKGWTVSNQGDFTQSGGVDLLVTNPKGELVTLETLTPSRNEVEIDNFRFVMGDVGLALVYAPNGFTCLWTPTGGLK